METRFSAGQPQDVLEVESPPSRDRFTERSQPSHSFWVKSSHWMVTLSFLTLVFSGYFILLSHPRLYWGEVGNDLTPALLELPISRNHQHGGWTNITPFFAGAGSPVSASRTYGIFNQNGWARSLHFLAGWFLVLPGAVYLVAGLLTGHFGRHLLPRMRECSFRLLLQDFLAHLQLRIRPATGGPQYGLLQKIAYCLVIFLALPLTVVTGLAMSPAITAAFPFLLHIFGGFQSARTIHFFATVFLVLFLVVHLFMVILSGFRRQIRGMTFGDLKR